MNIFLKKEIYFEITIENGSDRALVTRSFNEVVDHSFNELVRKIKLEESEITALKKLTGQKVNVRAITKTDFLKITNRSQRSEE